MILNQRTVKSMIAIILYKLQHNGDRDFTCV